MGMLPSMPRQARLLALLCREKIFVKQIHIEIGALNGPALVSQLRDKGWKIDCERVEVFERDSNVCHVGRYSLRPEQIELAKDLGLDRGLS